MATPLISPSDLPPSPADEPSPPPPSPPTSAPATDVPVAPPTRRPSRTGRRPKFTPDDDLIIVREVAAAKAHVSPNGTSKERYETAANKVNAAKKLSFAVTWKSVQDRYKRIQTRFDEMDKVEQGMSGVGGELGEMEDLLSVMKQARQDFNDEKSATRRAANAREAAKEQLGAEIREQAMQRRTSVSPGTDAGGSSSNLEPSPTKRTHRDAFQDPFEDDIVIFTRAIRQGDEARNRAEEERLLLDRERFEEERKERQMDREERREERAEASRLELEKFKILIGAFKQS